MLLRCTDTWTYRFMDEQMHSQISEFCIVPYDFQPWNFFNIYAPLNIIRYKYINIFTISVFLSHKLKVILKHNYELVQTFLVLLTTFKNYLGTLKFCEMAKLYSMSL